MNRCERLTFNTLTDPNWWTAFGSLEIGKSLIVKRFNPEPIEFNCVIIGLDWSISENGYIEGTINVSSTDPTI